MQIQSAATSHFKSTAASSSVDNTSPLYFGVGKSSVQMQHVTIAIKNSWRDKLATAEMTLTNDGTAGSDELIQRLTSGTPCNEATHPLVLDRPLIIQTHGEAIGKKHLTLAPTIETRVDLNKFDSICHNGIFFVAEQGLTLYTDADAEAALVLGEKPHGLIGYWPKGALGNDWKKMPPAGLQKGENPYLPLENYLLTPDESGLGLKGLVNRSTSYLKMAKADRVKDKDLGDFDILSIQKGYTSLNDLLQFLHDRKIIYSDIRMSCCRTGGNNLTASFKEKFGKLTSIAFGRVDRDVLHKRFQNEEAHRRETHKKITEIQTQVASLKPDDEDYDQKHSELKTRYVRTASSRDSMKNAEFIQMREEYAKKLHADLESLKAEISAEDTVDNLPELIQKLESSSDDLIGKENLAVKIENLKQQKRIMDEIKSIYHLSH